MTANTGSFPYNMTRDPSALSALAALATAYGNGASGTFGSDCTSWDLLALACDTKGGFRLTISGLTASASSNTLALRVNASKSNLGRSGFYGAFGAAPTLANSAGDSNLGAPNSGGGGAIGAGFTVTIQCDDPSTSGNRPRLLHVFSHTWTNPTTRAGQYQYWMMTYSGTDEIVSVGIEGTVAAALGAQSTYKMVRL
jgi:hypothetical protein